MAYSGNNPPTQIAINDMLSALNGQDQVTKSCRFIVRINPQGLLSRLSYFNDISKSMIFACDAAEFPGRGFQVAEMRYYGPKQMTPGNTTYGDGITLSFLVRSKTFERQLFDDWMDIINPSTSFHFKYPEDYYSTIEVFHYAEFGKKDSGVSSAGGSYWSPGNGITSASQRNSQSISPSANPTIKYEPEVIYGWRLLKAWPMMVNPQQVTWADTDILRLQVSFAYKYWDRPGDSEGIAKKIAQ
jgi:hypothetical protein